MSLRTKIYIERAKIVSDYGVCELLSEKFKNQAALVLVNFMIWAIVIGLFCEVVKPQVFTIEVAHASGALVTADEQAKQSDVLDPESKSTAKEVSIVRKSPGQSDIESMIRKAFPEEPETMIAIAKAESRLRADAINVNRNGTKDIGIFQINSVHGYDENWLKDPKNNLKAARAVYEKQGKEAWVTYNYAIANNKPI